MYGPPQASLAVTFGIAALAILVAMAFPLAVGRATGSRRAGLLAAAGAIAWLALTAGLAASGVLARFDARPPPFVLLLAATFALACAIAFSRLGRALATGLPLVVLVGFHAFRLPLELVMHRAANEGVMPVEMSFGGYNFDVLTGITAVLLAWILARSKGAPPAGLRLLVLLWNALGLGFLTVVLSIALASAPMVHAFGTDPRHVNAWVAYPPFVWLPAVLVLAAMAGHFVTLRKLLRAERRGVPMARAPDPSVRS